MAEHETIADIIAAKRRQAEHIRKNLSTVPVRRWDQWAEIKSLEDEADRLEAAHKRERVLAVSIMRSKLYGIAGGLRAITARSDARQRGIHYTEVQNIAAQIENIADNGGEA